MKICLRLKTMRRESGLLQRDLAEFLGVTQQSYARYEAGKAEPTIQTFLNLSLFYKTSVDYLIGATDDRTPYKRAVK